MKLFNLIRDFAPNIIHQSLLSIYNTYLYSKRHGGKYRQYLSYHKGWLKCKDSKLIDEEQSRRLNVFISFIKSNSKYYNSLIEDESEFSSSNLDKLPILNKSTLLESLFEISTIKESESIISYTGGTTGASMKVLYSYENMQERFAILDAFRNQFGYKLGEKTIWLSGKELLSKRDIKNNRFYKDDFINKIRFLSTFHINRSTFEHYWKALNSYKPKFIVGFPSSLYEICKYAEIANLKYDFPLVFFPTAETLTQEHRNTIQNVLNCEIYDQYASSEGAPFITECKDHCLHINPLSGIFEVIDENFKPSKSGEVLVTSFTTTGTPLVRYRIGDSITLSDDNCTCGSVFPVVKTIEGRQADYVFSAETGRISSVNLSNSTKYINGIIMFQAIQNIENEINIKVVPTKLFTVIEKQKFLSALRERLGHKISIDLMEVNEILKSPSGKFKVIINNLKDK